MAWSCSADGLIPLYSKEQAENNNNSKSKVSDKPKPQEYPVYKYSDNKKCPLHESVIMCGLPVFIKYENGEMKTVEKVEESSRIIRPPRIEEYPYLPYEFTNLEEVKKYVDRAKLETIDSLYTRAK